MVLHRAILLFFAAACSTSAAYAAPQIKISATATPREQYAAELLHDAVSSLPGRETILLATRHDALLLRYDKTIPDLWPGAKEAFILRRIGNTILVAGYDPSGVFYGTEELIDRIHAKHALPRELDFEDHPQLKIRGAVIGLQKPEITYDGAEYDYPYTPQSFPWFYDKAAWTRYLDQLAEQRTNALFLWNGHPFTSLLKLSKYPEAQELPDAQLEQNIAMFRWLTKEADKRGIWILQGFYNIHLSHAFARAHNLPYHLSAPSPLASEYTRYCISEFIREYPNVGIFMTLGEAMGPHYGPEWLTKTIIPGVLDGLAEEEKAVGHPVPQPPIVVRAHATDIDKVLADAKPLYSNIDSMWKWNGESLTWTNIRGSVRQKFQMMVANSNDTIVNMHLLSNLEPFRWGDPDFVRETAINFVRLGIGGVHVYPLRYWDWPVSADNTEPLLSQTDRDWIWFASWARYAWNPERDPAMEQQYWAEQFTRRFAVPGGIDAQGHSDTVVGLESLDTFTAQPHDYTAAQLDAGRDLLAAYEDSGVAAPEVIRRLGITEGNREVLSLGMTMPQLIDAARFNPATTLWTADAPDGEELNEWVANEINGGKHHGESPLSVAADAAEKSAKAVKEAEAASPGIAASAQPEYERVVNDMRCIAALMAFYNAKVQAAALVMRYGYDRNVAHLTAAQPLLAESVQHFAELSSLTEHTYRNAAGMETSQRQIPVRGGPDTNHWRELLPVYQKELAIFDHRLSALASGSAVETAHSNGPLPQVGFTLDGGGGEVFTVNKGVSLYTDQQELITALSPELDGLKGIRLSIHQETPIRFTLDHPAQILVGFFKSNSRKAMNVSPDTEQWNILLPDAVAQQKGLPISVWAKPLPAGENDLDLGKGAYVVLGFIPADTHVTPHVAFDPNSKQPPNLDWLFED
ncbi:hypothetical protein [Silvibacterium dinghuense]|uniref:Beta-hexosaminidase bacterial type N-terminal domain-containing protein n=1 Tax=Silvibacterium dinghuense TaxID=1560006 RepID=A0A4Q1SDF7_9BACT|nr:hypothetical protein [Silvibacterium dinghuense]RXS94928.1 hypothetical protein ESZ00_09820 [Silvibacterium dinghuense]GGH09106.1 hypothetical protein GCM10011586_26940 [Silvibacterium dinghuense]